MKQKQEEKQEEKTQQKIVYHYCKNIAVKKVVFELEKDNKTLFRIRFETDFGNITYKPSKSVLKSMQTKGILFETKDSEKYDALIFLQENKLIEILAENTLKSPQEVVLTLCEIFGETKEGEEISYYFLNKNQFETIFYQKIHGKDTSNLVAQELNKKKYSEKTLNEL